MGNPIPRCVPELTVTHQDEMSESDFELRYTAGDWALASPAAVNQSRAEAPKSRPREALKVEIKPV